MLLVTEHDVRGPCINGKRKLAYEQAVFGDSGGGGEGENETSPVFVPRPKTHINQKFHKCDEYLNHFVERPGWNSNHLTGNIQDQRNLISQEMIRRAVVSTYCRCAYKKHCDCYRLVHYEPHSWLVISWLHFASYHLPSRSDWTSISTNTRKSLIKY